MWVEVAILGLFATSLVVTLILCLRAVERVSLSTARAVAESVSAIVFPTSPSQSELPSVDLGLETGPEPEWMKTADSPDLVEWEGRPLTWTPISDKDSVTYNPNPESELDSL